MIFADLNCKNVDFEWKFADGPSLFGSIDADSSPVLKKPHMNSITTSRYTALHERLAMITAGEYTNGIYPVSARP